LCRPSAGGGVVMTHRRPIPPAPGPLEAYGAEFDDLFASVAQRRSFREYLAGLLLPRDRHKTLTALARAEPVVQAQAAPVQQLQFFLSESTWRAEAVNGRRLEVVCADPATRPHEAGVLVIDDSGDRKAGTKTAHVARQYLGSIGKIDTGIVAVTSLWADERVYYPLHVRPYTPAERLPNGKADPAFRTKPQLAVELVDAALEAGVPFRAVVADCFYGDNATFESALAEASLPYVLALKPSSGIWAPAEVAHTPEEAARELRWHGPEDPADWCPVVRRFRDGHDETWWAAELTFGPYGPDKSIRVVVATTDPVNLPPLRTWYLATNLPRPGAPHPDEAPFDPADLAEVVRLYGLRNWVEQSYKQVKHELGWADFMVRADRAIRRHWHLVFCAFSFCWRAWFTTGPPTDGPPPLETTAPLPSADSDATAAPERGKNGTRSAGTPAPGLLAKDTSSRPRLAGSLDVPLAVLARLVEPTPARGTPGAPQLRRPGSATEPVPPALTN
jgi:DDE superfamily endonuclease